MQGDKRIIKTNDLPTFGTTGNFPIQPGSSAYEYDQNPNRIGAQNYTLTVPANPTPAAQSSPIGRGPIGVLKDGVLLYSPLDVLNHDAVAHELQDDNQGHPSPDEAYHHHSIPLSWWANDDPTKPSTTVLGWAADGYPITGPRGDNGKILTDSDLDANHGTTSPIDLNGDGKLVNSYHYVATLEYPYVIGAFKGTPSNIEGLKPPVQQQNQPGNGTGQAPNTQPGNGTGQVPNTQPGNGTGQVPPPQGNGTGQFPPPPLF